MPETSLFARPYSGNPPTVPEGTRRIGGVLRVVREDAFEIESPDRDYWLGYVMAKGQIDAFGNGLCVSGAAEDRNRIEGLLAFLGSDHPIASRTKTVAGAEYPSIRTRVISLRLVRSLSKFGLTCPKSSIVDVAGVESSHFWRGYFEGRGYLRICRLGRTPTPNMSLHAPDKIMEKFMEFAGQASNGWKPRFHRRKSGTAKAEIAGRYVASILSVMYRGDVESDPTILARAREVLRLPVALRPVQSWVSPLGNRRKITTTQEAELVRQYSVRGAVVGDLAVQFGMDTNNIANVVRRHCGRVREVGERRKDLNIRWWPDPIVKAANAAAHLAVASSGLWQL